jgi:membrane associated rhomboid family serine protease
VLPLRDARPLRRTPVVTWTILVVCTIVFGVEVAAHAIGGESSLDILVHQFGLVPADLTALLRGTGTGDGVPPPLALLTHMFLHGSWYHVIGNALFLWIFGPAVEDRMGRPVFLAFYLVGGLAAAFGHILSDPASTAPMVGASGAISAVLGAYLVLYPKARIQSLVFLVFFYELIAVPSVLVLGVWFLFNLVDAFASLGMADGAGATVAFWAHVGGFVAGALLALPFGGLRRSVAVAGPIDVDESAPSVDRPAAPPAPPPQPPPPPSY